MKILCCLDGTNADAVSRAAQMFAGAQPPVIGLLTVMDVGPRRAIDRTRERFWRPPMHRQPVIQEMLGAEKEAAEEILQAGLERLPKLSPCFARGILSSKS